MRTVVPGPDGEKNITPSVATAKAEDDELRVELIASFLTFSVFCWVRGRLPSALVDVNLYKFLLELDDELLETHDRMLELRKMWARDLTPGHMHACIAFVRIFMTRFLEIRQLLAMIAAGHPVSDAIESGNLTEAVSLLDGLHAHPETRPVPNFRFIAIRRWTPVDYPLAARNGMVKLATTRTLPAPLPSEAQKSELLGKLEPSAGEDTPTNKKKKKNYKYLGGFNEKFLSIVAMRSAECVGPRPA